MTAPTTTEPTRAVLPRRSLVGIFGGLFAGYLGLSSVIPVIPGFVRDRFGAANFLVGLAVTATALTALLVRPIAGALADRHGYRPVMQVGARDRGGGRAALLRAASAWPA